MHIVKDRENKKAQRNEKERSKEKIGMVQQKKKMAYAHAPSKIGYIFTWKLNQKPTAVSESAFLAKFREMQDRRAKKIDQRLKKTCFFGEISAY